ncbi:MAG TPA: ABC transporter permease subunit [Dehalococcoidia bacterium]|nr:ABC transporter permease subunit [Dehalococcoidia bacterium]
MPRPSIFRKTLRDLRWQIVWYGLGLGLMAAFVVYVYPSYSSQLADLELPDAMKAMIGNADYGTPQGFLSGELLSWAPLVLVVFAVMGGTSALAGEEANGTMDLLLAQPISRVRLALEKLVALLVATLAICAIIYAGFLISVPFVDINIGLDDLLAGTLNLVPLVLLFESFSMWAGVALPSRGVATGLSVAVAVASYFFYYLGNLVDALHPLRWTSVFYHYHGTEVLSDGINWAGVLLLCSLYVLFAVWALYLFQQRDIGVASQGLRLPWQRGAVATSESTTG